MLRFIGIYLEGLILGVKIKRRNGVTYEKEELYF